MIVTAHADERAKQRAGCPAVVLYAKSYPTSSEAVRRQFPEFPADREYRLALWRGRGFLLVLCNFRLITVIEA